LSNTLTPYSSGRFGFGACLLRYRQDLGRVPLVPSEVIWLAIFLRPQVQLLEFRHPSYLVLEAM
jgi:hypothetical protein